ncbi:MAG TPA: SAM-dependent methyltransferase [Cyanobacteria bacterium UBA11372]|nr:SAM-dependent methyltransferase [Cyanobacteria bacterium UBA11372]
MKEENAQKMQLHEMNPLDRFSDRVEDYVKYRPSYPKDAIAHIISSLKTADPVVADIGAGTGISSRLLAELHSIRVIAIEPNAEMRQAAETHALVEFRDGTAEATNLADNEVDLVTCFQSFHWFNPALTLPEFHRILKRDGRLAIVWNSRDRQDIFTEKYSNIVRKASNNHPGEKRSDAIKPFLESSLFGNRLQSVFPYKQMLNLAGLVGRAMSTSYIPKSGEAYEELLSDLQQLFESSCDENGFVGLVYQTEVYLGKPIY